MVQATPIPTRRLGARGPEVPVLSLGSWNTWDRMDFDDALAVVDRALKAGVNMFDIAHYNMGPHAENAQTDIIFGRIIRELGLERSAWQMCGKLWLWEYPEVGFSQQMETSLERIGIEKAEMVVVGDYFTELDIGQVVDDVAAEIDAGHFDYWGVNNWHIDDLTKAIEVAAERGLTPPCFAQLKYGPVRRSMAEGEHYGAMFAQGLGLQASDVFEGGILVGNLAPTRKIGADVGGIREKIVEVYPKVKRIAEEFDATPAQVVIAFCLANGNVGNVLIGVSRLTQLEDNLGAVELLERVGPERIREASAQLWLDQHVPTDGTPMFPGA